jgi:toxin FitB
MIILDTNVVSEPLKQEPDSNVIQWLARQSPETLFITAITAAELHSGLAQLPAGRRREALAKAINGQVLALFSGKVLVFDLACADHFGAVIASANKAGNPISFPDAAIAAIALKHRFQIATRNVSDFNAVGAKLINPWLETANRPSS